MKTKPLYPSTPYFILTALLALAPVLNNKYPQSFFPAVGPEWIEVGCSLGGMITAFLGLTRFWNLLQVRTGARLWLRDINQSRLMGLSKDEGDIVTAGRSVTRLIRNAEMDLEEIGPDFTWGSLKRLQGYLPNLLLEIHDEESASIRLGIVGAYIGETLCRTRGWQWFFKANPNLKQFTFLPSVVQKNGQQIDPFNLAYQAMAEKAPLLKFLEKA